MFVTVQCTGLDTEPQAAIDTQHEFLLCVNRAHVFMLPACFAGPL